MRSFHLLPAFLLSFLPLLTVTAQWQDANTGIPGFLYPRAFASQGDILFTGGSEDLGSLILCKSTNQGTTWTVADSGIARPDSTYVIGTVWSIAANSSRAYATAWMSSIFPDQEIRGLFKTENAGTSWSLNSPQDNFNGVIVVDSIGTLFACAWNKIFTTTDGGATWDSSIVIPFSQGAVTSLFIRDDLMLAQMYSSSEDALFRSSDRGVTWNRITSGIPVHRFSLKAFCIHANSLFGCGGQNISNSWQNLLLKSTDDGITWLSPTNDLTSTGIATSLVSYQNGLFIGAAATVLLSIDEGISWTNVGGGGAGGLTKIWGHGSYLFAGSAYQGVKRHLLSQFLPVQLASFTGRYLTATRVQLEWVTVSELNNYGFSIERRSADQTFNEMGFVAGHGTTNEPHHYEFIDSTVNSTQTVYRLKQIDLDGSAHYSEPIQISSVTTVTETKPAMFMLYQNHPNPFNPGTNIAYDLPKTSFVSLKIFNMIGQEVATLINGVQDAGFKSVTFDASALASGVYLYRILAGDFVQAKKMILIK